MSGEKLRAVLRDEFVRRDKPQVVKRSYRRNDIPRDDLKAYYREYRSMRRASGVEPMNYR